METILPGRVRPTHSQYCPEVWTPAVSTPSSQQTWRHRLATTSQSVHQLSPLPGSVVLSPFSDYYLLSPPLCSALSPGPSGLGVLMSYGREVSCRSCRGSFLWTQGKEQMWRTLAFPPHTTLGKTGPTRATMSAEKCNRIPAVSVTKTSFCDSVYLVPKDRGGSHYGKE